MIDARPSGRERYERALAEGALRLAVFAYLLWLYAGHPSRWPDYDRLEEVMARDAVAFCRTHGAPVSYAEAGGPVVRRAARYTRYVADHKGHWLFGRPVHTWRKEPWRWHVGREQMLLDLAKRQGVLEVSSRMGVLKRQRRAREDRDEARALRDAGLTPREIEQRVGCSRASVYRYLADGEDGVS